MNATDTEERMRQGFAELLRLLRIEDAPDYRKTIRANTEAREAAQARVNAEYRDAGLDPPDDLNTALSLTAIRDMESRGILLNSRATGAGQGSDAYQEAGE